MYLFCLHPQNESMVNSLSNSLAEVERDLWKSCGSTPLLKEGHLKLAVRYHVTVTVEYLQR